MLVRPDPDELRRGPGAGSVWNAGSPKLVRLVPNSGIQFIEITLAGREFGRTQQVFIEDQYLDEQGPRTALMVVPAEAVGDEVAYHPVSLQPVTRERTLWLSGYDAIEPFLGAWVPLPCFRLRASRPDQPVTFEDGPSNWARLYVERPQAPVRTVTTFKAVLALDTRIEPIFAVDAPGYLAPTREDGEHDAEFALDADLASLTDFVGQPWVEEWLGEVAKAGRQAEGGGTAAQRFEHEHVARYLTLLQVLTRHSDLPRIRFVREVRHDGAARRSPVDLVLDIGNQQTAALLVERSADSSFTVLQDAITLKLRDLSSPTQCHSGPISTEIEFAAATFGNPALSRRSGRPDAFQWPSLVRIGEEARRLANRPGAVQGVTGLSGLKARLNDTAPSRGMWRFARAEPPAIGQVGAGQVGVGQVGMGQGPIVSGDLLRHLAEDGAISDAAGGKLPALRPRFSPSSTLTLFAAELVLHALAQINAPAVPGSAVAPARPARELRRIVVSSAAAMPEAERAMLVARVAAAVDLVWRGQGWDGDASAPPKPRVLAGFDADLAAQLVYLFEELRTRFGGNVHDFVELARRWRAGRPPVPTLRIASVDLGGGASNLAVVDYNVSASGVIHASLSHAERHSVAGDGLVDAICRAHIVPALSAALRRAGIAAADLWLDGLLSRREALASPGGPDDLLATALESKVLRPAAAALKDIYLENGPRSRHGAFSFDLLGLVERGKGRCDPVLQQLAALARAAGAGGPEAELEPAGIPVTLRWSELSGTIRGVLQPLVAWLAGTIAPRECDFVLLSGASASLGELIDELNRLLPLPPRRLVNMRMRDNELLGMPAGAEAHRDPTWLAGAVGAYMASRNVLGSDSFNFDTSRLRMAEQPAAALGTASTGGGGAPAR